VRACACVHVCMCVYVCMSMCVYNYACLCNSPLAIILAPKIVYALLHYAPAFQAWQVPGNAAQTRRPASSNATNTYESKGWPEPHIYTGIHGVFGRDITKSTVIYSVSTRFWPTLHMTCDILTFT